MRVRKGQSKDVLSNSQASMGAKSTGNSRVANIAGVKVVASAPSTAEHLLALVAIAASAHWHSPVVVVLHGPQADAALLRRRLKAREARERRAGARRSLICTGACWDSEHHLETACNRNRHPSHPSLRKKTSSATEWDRRRRIRLDRQATRKRRTSKLRMASFEACIRAQSEPEIARRPPASSPACNRPKVRSTGRRGAKQRRLCLRITRHSPASLHRRINCELETSAYACTAASTTSSKESLAPRPASHEYPASIFSAGSTTWPRDLARCLASR
ncbi:hypothetical protein D9611_007937 [Ephemerocybe angulata]|uniref:Uncharacterized protein n=1 Tax=Ephemerocybe angulata TaxID=980116 RepID=A0A8H5CEF9_9AGAR|nr:hypothetical protein D9611_007937 [Tulosesus angulatus]